MVAQAHVQAVHGRQHVAVALSVGTGTYQMLHVGVLIVAQRDVGIGRVAAVVDVTAVRGSGIVVVVLVKDLSHQRGGGESHAPAALDSPCS